jgi:hypothetical protein
MPRRNRQTLKKSFRHGKRPSQEDFENLIDSTVNILDDGFSKSPETGMGLAPLLEHGSVLSVFKETSDAKPQWELVINQGRDLEICRCTDAGNIPVVSLKIDGSIVLCETGKATVFGGTVNMPVREGTYYRGSVPADGYWHDITGELEGNVALEVAAAAGKQHSGKHAIVVATAIACFGAHTKIRKTRSYYGMYGYKICLRWKKIRNRFKAKLQMKTIFQYGDNTQIQYHITSLWNDSSQG